MEAQLIRLAVKTRKKCQPAKNRQVISASTPNRPMMVHGVPCQGPPTDVIQEVGVEWTLGARWLLGGARRLGNATSSVVVFCNEVWELRSRLKLRVRWHPIEAYDFNRGRRGGGGLQ